MADMEKLPDARQGDGAKENFHRYYMRNKYVETYAL
jgi:hypothetical protein